MPVQRTGRTRAGPDHIPPTGVRHFGFRAAHTLETHCVDRHLFASGMFVRFPNEVVFHDYGPAHVTVLVEL